MPKTVDNGYYLPGELIKDINSKDKQTIIGPGLRRNDEEPNTLIATQAGTLVFRPPNTYWIESRRNRYIPKKGDYVVGIITKKSGDTLRVDVGGAEPASLSMLAFEGATKKMKPDVNVGDTVFARVLNAHKEMEPELVCVDQYGKSGRLGVLSNDGFLVHVKQRLVQTLLNPENPLLRTIARKFPYEIVIGVNGKVWIKANQARDVLVLCRAFEAAEFESEKGIIEACRQQK
ncbi:exosome complex component RRP40 [Anthonomus grandis grandis]|uniref:exosome complex component RRP40 n=1 Tax=Anthonomus grandis grandis TaxID=2921223 RepID=UPI002165F2FC|nr:exosome complex component RRP40 [Anthonomus grandis grandis]